MGAFSWLFNFFLSTWGIIFLAAIDSSVIGTVPFALDVALVILVAQHRNIAWLYPVLVIPASEIGPASTYWIGRVIGHEGLERFVPRRRLKNVERRIRNSGAFALALLDLIPPPFPFMPFALASGALEVDGKIFLLTVAAVRAVRFTVETLLALWYGPALIGWLESEAIKRIGGVLFGLALLGVLVSAYRLIRSSRPHTTQRHVRA